MIIFKIDEFSPCLKEVTTGEIYDTEVVKIRRKSFLAKFNKKTEYSCAVEPPVRFEQSHHSR